MANSGMLNWPKYFEEQGKFRFNIFSKYISHIPNLKDVFKAVSVCLSQNRSKHLRIPILGLF